MTKHEATKLLIVARDNVRSVQSSGAVRNMRMSARLLAAKRELEHALDHLSNMEGE